MGLSIPVVLKDKDKGKTLDGFGVALEAITLDPTTRTGADQEIMHLLDHIFLLEMIMLWIRPPLFAKPRMIKNARSTKRLADASNAGSKATSSAIVPTRKYVLVQLALYKSKMMTNRSSLTPHLQLRLLLRK